MYLSSLKKTFSEYFPFASSKIGTIGTTPQATDSTITLELKLIIFLDFLIRLIEFSLVNIRFFILFGSFPVTFLIKFINIFLYLTSLR